MNFTKNMHKLILIWGRANCFIHKKQAKLHFKKILLRPQRHLCLSKKNDTFKVDRAPTSTPATRVRFPAREIFFFLIFFFNFSIIAIFHIKFTSPVHRHAIKELNGINFSYTYKKKMFFFNFRFVNSLSSRSDK